MSRLCQVVEVGLGRLIKGEKGRFWYGDEEKLVRIGHHLKNSEEYGEAVGAGATDEETSIRP